MKQRYDGTFTGTPVDAAGVTAQLLMKLNDPMSVNKQGNDTGIQYRTGIYYTDEEQLPEVQQVYAAEEEKAGASLAVELNECKERLCAGR